MFKQWINKQLVRVLEKPINEILNERLRRQNLEAYVREVASVERIRREC